MKRLIVILTIIVPIFSLYSNAQQVVYDSIQTDTRTIITNNINIDGIKDYGIIDYDFPIYHSDLRLACYTKDGHKIYYIVIQLFNSRYKISESLDYAISFKTFSGKRIRLKPISKAKHDVNYKQYYTYKDNYRGRISVNSEFGQSSYYYDVEIPNPQSSNTDYMRSDSYRMEVMYWIKKEELVELFSGVKEIRINNAKIKYSGEHSHVKRKFENDIIGTYLEKSCYLIEEKLNKKQ